MSLVRSPVVAVVLLMIPMLSPAGAAAILTDPPMVPPTPPMNVGWTEDGGEVTVTWDPPLFFGGAESVTYRVYKDSSLVADGLITTAYSEPAAAGESASASYTVTAVNDAGESAQMDSGCVAISPAPFVDPIGCVGLVIDIVLWVIDQTSQFP